MKYNFLLFDSDDTLLDFRAAENRALERLMEHINSPCPERDISLYREINARWWKRVESGDATRSELSVGRLREFSELSGLSFDPLELSEYYLERLGEGSQLIDGALEVCRLLREKGAHMYVITNGIKSVQSPRWRNTPLAPLFDGVFISEAIGHSKPSREFFDHVLSAIGEPPKSDILIIGDSLSSDIKGGADCGIDTCWINPSHADCGEHKPTYTLDSISRLPQILL